MAQKQTKTAQAASTPPAPQHFPFPCLSVAWLNAPKSKGIEDAAESSLKSEKRALEHLTLPPVRLTDWALQFLVWTSSMAHRPVRSLHWFSC